MIELRIAKPYDWPDVEDLLENAMALAGVGTEWAKHAIVAEAAGTFVGVAIVELLGDSGVLRAVAVHLDWQRRGVGSALVGRVAAHAAELGVGWLFTRTASCEGFLRGVGFEVERPDLVPREVESLLPMTSGKVMCYHCELGSGLGRP